MGSKATAQPVGPVNSKTYRAEGTLTYLTRGRAACKGTAEDQCKASTGAAARCLGVVDETPSAVGQPVNVIRHGECIAISGQAALLPGTRVKVEIEGDFIDADAADVESVGYAVTTAAADGDEFVIFVDLIHKRS